MNSVPSYIVWLAQRSFIIVQFKNIYMVFMSVQNSVSFAIEGGDSLNHVQTDDS